MDNGWIKIHRKILDWEWFTDVNTAHLFTCLLLLASTKDRKWKSANIQKGSFISSHRILAKKTGLSVMQVRTSTNKLILTGELTVQRHPKYGLYKLNNYCVYQEVNREVNNQVTGKQQGSNTSIRIKELKNVVVVGNDDDNDDTSPSETAAGVAEGKRSLLDTYGQGQDIGQFASLALKLHGLTESQTKFEIAKFMNYWREPDDEGVERWQRKRYFDVDSKLTNWIIKIRKNI